MLEHGAAPARPGAASSAMLLPRRGTRDWGARRLRRAEAAVRALGGGATSASPPFLSPLLPPPARHRGERETPPPPPLTGRAGRGSAASCQAAPAAARLTPPPCSGGTAHARQRHRGRGASPPAVPLPPAAAGVAPLGEARPAGIPRYRLLLTAGMPALPAIPAASPHGHQPRNPPPSPRPPASPHARPPAIPAPSESPRCARTCGGRGWRGLLRPGSGSALRGRKGALGRCFCRRLGCEQ